MEILHLFGDGHTFIFETKKTTAADIPRAERYQWHLMIGGADSTFTFVRMTNAGDKGTRTFLEGYLMFDRDECNLVTHGIKLPRLDPTNVNLRPANAAIGI